jgi:hypothetical protein
VFAQVADRDKGCRRGWCFHAGYGLVNASIVTIATSYFIREQRFLPDVAQGFMFRKGGRFGGMPVDRPIKSGQNAMLGSFCSIFNGIGSLTDAKTWDAR